MNTIKIVFFMKFLIIFIKMSVLTFLSGIGRNNVYKIGNNIMDNIKNDLLRIDRHKSINNKKSRKMCEKIQNNIHNKVTDLHWKSINYLINNEKIRCILIGNWSKIIKFF